MAAIAQGPVRAGSQGTRFVVSQVHMELQPHLLLNVDLVQSFNLPRLSFLIH